MSRSDIPSEGEIKVDKSGIDSVAESNDSCRVVSKFGSGVAILLVVLNNTSKRK